MGKGDKKKKKKDDTSTTESVWEMDSSMTSQASSTTVTDTETSAIEDDTGAAIEEKDSLEELDERTEVEKELFRLIWEGDRKAVKSFIAENRVQIDVSHRDLNGDDLLTHAVIVGDEKLVKLILNVNPGLINIYDGLIAAVSAGHMEIVLTLLKFEDVRQGGAFYATTKKLVEAASERKKKDYLKDMSTSALIQELDQKKYGNGITPLIAAASNGHYEIIQVLYDRGERLPMLHLPSCSCHECKGATRDLQKIAKRIELLKAMSNPTYLIFMAGQDGSFDPIYEAFNISSILGACMAEEPEFNAAYAAILEEVDKLPVALLGLCRSMEETKILLSPTEGYVGPSSVPYPRLTFAIDCGQKEFVVHQHVECLIRNMWIGHPWNTKTKAEKAIKYFIVAFMMLVFPLFDLVLWLAMFCCMELPLIQFCLSPINRCLAKLTSQIYFIALLVYMNAQEKAEGEIEPPTIYCRWIVVVYISTSFLALLRRFLVNPGRFWKKGWNKIETIAQICFWSSFILWVLLWERKASLPFEQVITRQQLEKEDPLLIEECLFAVASTMFSLKVMRFYVLPQFVGPVQTAIAKMWRSGLVVIFFIGWAAATFVIGSRIMFRPYANVTEYDENKEKIKEQNMDSTKPFYMFLAFVGIEEVPPESSKLCTPTAEYVNEMGEEDTVENEPVTANYFLMGITLFYNMLMLGFLKDTVLGLFSGRGEEVLEAKEIEWRYLRIQEWMHQAQETYLTPPMNFFPTPSGIKELFSCITPTIRRKKKKAEAQDVESDKAEGDLEKQYPFLMRKLFMRYFQSKMAEDDEENKPESRDVENVMNTLFEVKNLALEIIGKDRSSRRSSKS